MTTHRAPAQAEWTPWAPLAGLWPLLRVALDESDQELKHRLVRLERMGLMEFGHDGEGDLFYRSRMDGEAQALALLDDHAQSCRN